MRLNVFIGAFVTCLTLDLAAELYFSEPEWKGDLGISIPMINFSTAAPFDMPRADAYLVTGSDGSRKLVDKFNVEDLWFSRTLRGSWIDDYGNRLTIARFTHLPPIENPNSTMTRFSFYSDAAGRKINAEDEKTIHSLAQYASIADVGVPYKPHRSKRKSLKDIWFYETTNEHAIVCTFRPSSPEKKEKTDWYLVTLELSEKENPKEAFETFNEKFIDKIHIPVLKKRGLVRKNLSDRFEEKSSDRGKTSALPSEKELTLDDYRKSVANYSEWNYLNHGDIAVVDNLDPLTRKPFIAALTNNLPKLQKAYKVSMPSPLSTNDHIVAVKIFATRDEYLSYIGEKYSFTAAVWSPLHRELVLYLPEGGGNELLRTVWHEAFHQYLSYASSMISSSPWINEGHAELFENSHFDRDGNIVFEAPPDYVATAKSLMPQFSELFPVLVKMDYTDFYSGTQEERILKYRLAWSIAYFLEIGAPQIRFKPYETLREDYTKALMETKNMHEATKAVFSDEKIKDFVNDYLKFWNEL